MQDGRMREGGLLLERTLLRSKSCQLGHGPSLRRGPQAFNPREFFTEVLPQGWKEILGAEEPGYPETRRKMPQFACHHIVRPPFERTLQKHIVIWVPGRFDPLGGYYHDEGSTNHAQELCNLLSFQAQTCAL